MRNLLVSALVVAAAAGVSSQSPGQPPQPGAAFRTDARLVRVSVVVQDRRGEPVGGLKPDDFELLEDGKPQPVAVFTVEGSTGPAMPGDPEVFSNRLDGPSASGVTVLLYDRLNTQFEHQALAKRHILTYLRQLKPQDRVGFFVLESDAVSVLHDFSRDVASLLKALDRAAAATSRELTASGEKVLRTEPTGDALIDSRMEEWALQAERQIQGFATESRVKATTAAMEALARHLAGVRGRKNVIWISSGFPIRFHDGIIMRSATPEIFRAARALNDADIAFYPVDARGLVGAFATPAGARQQEFVTLDGIMRNVDSSQVIAQQTGGRAYFNTNDLGGAITRAAEDSRLTYVLGYYPSHATWDGRFRQIQVRVRRRGIDVRHRRGYYALPPAFPGPESRQNSIVEALNSPLDATGITMAVRVARTAKRDEFTLEIRVEPDSVLLSREAGEWTGAIDIAIAQELPDGRLFNSLDTTVPLRFSDAMRERLLVEGLTLTRTLTLRADTHQVRVALRDGAGAVGTVTIPASRLRNDPKAE